MEALYKGRSTMTTTVRTFKAGSMHTALQRVRQELGGDAVVLQTRQTVRRRLLRLWKPQCEVEITAGLGVNVRPPRARRVAGPAATPAPSFTAEIGDAGLELASGQSEVRDQRSAVGAQTSSDSAPELSVLNTHLSTRLDSIQKMLEKLGRPALARQTEEIPAERFHLYTELIDADVHEELARELVLRLKQIGTPEQLDDPAASQAMLAAMVESELRCCDPIAAAPGRRKVVALVGATGVGKTTTIAKLAANLRLRDGIKMGLVTVDTYRIAAVEQLRTYAEIIDLPMRVVTSPPEMRRTMDELSGLDLVLIDTAGRSPRDELQINELKRLLVEARVDEVHLVLSLTAGLKSLLSTAEKFAVAGTTSMILTKLDEAASLGTALSLCRQVRLPISYLTTGQDVPDDIEPVRPTRLARLILGQDRLGD